MKNDTTAPPISDKEHEEILFQYHRLREEILHNDVMSMQQLAAVLVLVGVIMGFAFSDKIEEKNIILKSLCFVIASGISSFGFLQHVDRIRTTFKIASFMRIFLEEHTTQLKWERRLQEFRTLKKDDADPRSFAFLSLYGVVIFINFILALGFFYESEKTDFFQEVSNLVSNPKQHFNATVFYATLLYLVVLTALFYSVISKYRRAVIKNKETYDANWNMILQKERIGGIEEILKKYKTEKGLAAQSLADLIAAGYLAEIPYDPLTGKQDWIVKTGQNGELKIESNSRSIQSSVNRKFGIFVSSFF